MQAHHGTSIRQEYRLFRVFYVGPAVADAEVELAVGAKAQAVQIMAKKADVDAEAVVQQFALIGLAYAGPVAGLPRRLGIQVYQTSPLRVTRPAPMPSAAL